ncbi:MAG: hypothetical protein J7K84_05030 [Deltaproteobacteria bacterium]|nr:hypothetical protein [Deltaproteobacteria bacterium]
MIFKRFLFLPVLILIFSCTSTIETDILLPITFENIPKGLTITGHPLKSLEVRIRGSESLIESLSGMKLQYKFDLTAVNVGVQSIQIKKDGILLPPGVAILKITPSFLAVRIEHEIIKEVPVFVSLSGRPASGFIVTSAVARPQRIVLSGPENTLEPLTSVMTKPIDLKGSSESFKKNTAIELINNVEIISEPRIFVAEISIDKKIITKRFKDISVEGIKASFPYSITPPRIDIELKGSVNILEKINPVKDIKVCIDLKDLNPGVYNKRASIKIPVQTTLSKVTPEIFIVRINTLIK